MNELWINRFFELADFYATWSKDPSTKVGAVIVDPLRIIVGLGYNGFARGVIDLPSRYDDKDVKHKLVVHAEMNAILNSIVSLRDCVMFSTKFPCSECAKAIIQKGIVAVYTRHPARTGIWAIDAEYSRMMMEEAQVTIVCH